MYNRISDRRRLLEQLPRPTIFAHRGSSTYAPENTISAFNFALQQGADAIELDVKLTADQHPVVIHDRTVDRTTDGAGTVQNMSLLELRELDAGSFFNAQFRGEKIPTLEEVFEEFGGKIFINVELTNYSNPTDALPKIAAELVIKLGLQEDVLFSSFNPIALFKINKYLPQTPKGLLIGSGLLGTTLPSRIYKFVPHDALHPAMSITNPELIQKVHHSGQRVYVFTVNHAQDMSSLFAMGVDGIFTDDPILGRKMVNSSSTIMDENVS